MRTVSTLFGESGLAWAASSRAWYAVAHSWARLSR